MDKTLTTEFDGLDLTIPTIPPRSRLYHLKPVGIGTPQVESLTSYIIRLAEAHCVSVAALYRWELVPIVRKLQANSLGSEAVYKDRSPSGVIYSSKPINGLSANARIWIQALEILTLRQDLSFLTCSSWGTDFSRHLLLRKSPAWCPDCYDEWLQSGKVIYAPLLWMLNVVTICINHMRLLEQYCPSCSQQSHFLAFKSRSGYCSHCQAWLGTVEKKKESRTEIFDNDVSYEFWVANTVSEWVKVAQSIPSLILKEDIARTLSSVIHEFTDGNVDAFSKYLGICSELVYSWRSGEHMPRFDYLLKICYALGLPLAEFLSGDISSKDLLQKNEAFKRLRERLSSSPRNASNVRERLKAVLAEEPPPPLSEVATQFGYKNENSLRYVSPVLCKAITARHKASVNVNYKVAPLTKRICDDDTIRKTLELALAQECPPPVKGIAQSLQYKSSQTLYVKYPDLCYQITAKRLKYYRKRLPDIKLSLEKAVKEDPPPSLSKVKKRVRVKHSDYLYNLFPELTGTIVMRYDKWRTTNNDRVRLNLQAAFKENPPRPLSHIAEQYGYLTSGLYKHHRKLCHKISSRYSAYRRLCIKERKSLFKEEVKKVVIKLYELGACPSVKQVSSRLENPSIKSFCILREILNEVKKECQLLDNVRH